MNGGLAPFGLVRGRFQLRLRLRLLLQAIARFRSQRG